MFTEWHSLVFIYSLATSESEQLHLLIFSVESVYGLTECFKEHGSSTYSEVGDTDCRFRQRNFILWIILMLDRHSAMLFDLIMVDWLVKFSNLCYVL